MNIHNIGRGIAAVIQWAVVIFFTLILIAYWTDTIWGILDWIAAVNSQGDLTP